MIKIQTFEKSKRTITLFFKNVQQISFVFEIKIDINIQLVQNSLDGFQRFSIHLKSLENQFSLASVYSEIQDCLFTQFPSFIKDSN